MSSDFNAIVIGGGVIGIAIARHLAKTGEVLLIEEHSKFGQETSSRNSEVIHSGIHYPKDSQKTSLCIEGRNLLYSYLLEKKVAHEKCGKFVVACNPEEADYLVKLKNHSEGLAVPALFMDTREVSRLEPKIRIHSAVYFPETGIVNSHEFMASLERDFIDEKGTLIYRHKVVKVEKSSSHWQVFVSSGVASQSGLTAPFVVNAGGLAAAELSNQTLRTTRYEHRYCRGRYFMLSSKFRGAFKHLIYPVPQKDGLGIHITIDTEKNSRLGPDTDWCSDSQYEKRALLYDCKWEELSPRFLTATQRYCPSVEAQDLSPGLIGIRPKLFIDSKAHPDFLIENHDGFIHCLGIESPGLTASLAIARRVENLMTHTRIEK